MPPTTNRQVRLKSRPVGIPQAEHFEIVAAPLPELKEREFLVRNDFLSVEPAMRGWVNAVAFSPEQHGHARLQDEFRFPGSNQPCQLCAGNGAGNSLC